MIMEALFTIFILLELMQYIIFADIILSWLRIFWLNIRPKFLADIIDPIYWFVKKYLPTTIWPLDFTPIVILMIIYFLIGWVDILFPWSYTIFKAYF